MAIARPLQLLWLVGTVVFLIALFTTRRVGGAPSWISTSIPLGHETVRQGERVSMHEHLRLAEKSWAKTVAQRHELLKEWADPETMPFFPASNAVEYHKHPYSIWDFVPASWSCPYEMERIGRMGDGGKWVCGMSLYEQLPVTRPCVVYSFGVQFESSYEDETIARTHCEVWAYDFSVTDFGKQLNEEHKLRAHFTQAGIAGTTNTSYNPPFYNIQDLMKKNGHDYIDILKMDIEYAEFEALTSLDKAFPQLKGLDLPIGQLMVELHLFSIKGMTAPQFLKWWEVLEGRGLRPVWTEPNLLYTTMRAENGGDPRLAEYTFVNIKDRRSVLFGTSEANSAAGQHSSV